MANNVVTVNLDDNHKVDLLTDSPNISALVEEVVNIEESLDIDAITVDCDLETFDSKSFTEVIQESIRFFVQELRIETEKYNAAVDNLRARR